MTDTAARLAHDVDRHAQVVAAAEHAWREARRRHLALERMRERAWVRHQQAEQREELKRLDELARVRHILGVDANESRERDDL
jgi:flagellar export protein FliJ